MNLINEYIIDKHLYIQIMPVLAGIICYSKLNKEYRLFVSLLIFTVCIEIFKQYYGKYIHIGQNRIWTNIYYVIYFPFLFWIFHKKSKHTKFKIIIKYIVLLYFLSIGYEVIIKDIDYQFNYQVIPFIIGGIGVLMCTFDYLIGVINSKTEINIFKDFLFWFVIAHFIYFLAFTPFKISENYFSLINDYKPHIITTKKAVTLFKCVLLSIGFLWTTYKKEE